MQVLPVWEMTFANMPDSQHRIATERVKWSPKYQKKMGIATGLAASLPKEVADRVQHIARRVYRTLEQSGYSRIDLRLDEAGRDLRARGEPKSADCPERRLRRVRGARRSALPCADPATADHGPALGSGAAGITGPLRTLVAGCGQMGSSHARAYHRLPDFDIVGLVARGAASRADAQPGVRRRVSRVRRLHAAPWPPRGPTSVCISTYTETHADYAIAALEAGAHVFLEKPVAATIDDAARVIDTARRLKQALVVGYILQVHPAWQRFTEIARTLGTPLVMRMNLNQQSSGHAWPRTRTCCGARPPSSTAACTTWTSCAA